MSASVPLKQPESRPQGSLKINELPTPLPAKTGHSGISESK
jgi:hypothetical protein